MGEITVQEFVKVYGANSVTFMAYYKYSFCYTGYLPNGNKITVFCGNGADSIYRWEVIAGESKTIRELYMGVGLEGGYVTNRLGDEIVSFERGC